MITLKAEYKDGHLHIYVGDMLTGKLQDIYIQFQFLADEQLADFTFSAKAFGKGDANQIYDAHAEMVYKYAPQADVDAEAVNREIMERYSAVELADKATEALKLERQGRRDEAHQMLQESIARNRPFVAAQTTADFDRMSERMRTGMTEADRKLSHWDSYNIKRQKPKEEDKKKD